MPCSFTATRNCFACCPTTSSRHASVARWPQFRMLSSSVGQSSILLLDATSFCLMQHEADGKKRKGYCTYVCIGLLSVCAKRIHCCFLPTSSSSLARDAPRLAMLALHSVRKR
jgi:hypothetical protein